ncbi:MAG: hypothetical protein ACLQT7_09305 [Candidatus Dormibacteria bacterium]
MVGVALAAVVAAGAVLLALDLRSSSGGATGSASSPATASASQLVSPPPRGSTPLLTPSPTSAIPLPGISSTVSAAPPLAVHASWTNRGQLIARNYQGAVVGTFSMNTDFAGYYGYLVSPDGSKVYLGDGAIMGIDGAQLGAVPTAEIASPVWADASDHLCGMDQSSDLLEVTVAGAVVSSTPVGTRDANVVGCSPGADRAVVLTSEGSQVTAALVVRLSTETVLATHPTTDYGSASHDCQLFASDGPGGVTLRNVATWAVVGAVVRESGSPAPGTTSIAMATGFSWDGSRITLIASVSPPDVMTFVVSLSDGATLLQSTNLGQGEVGTTVIPLVGTSEYLLSQDSGAYLLGSAGQLTALPG